MEFYYTCFDQCKGVLRFATGILSPDLTMTGTSQFMAYSHKFNTKFLITLFAKMFLHSDVVFDNFENQEFVY